MIRKSPSLAKFEAMIAVFKIWTQRIDLPLGCFMVLNFLNVLTEISP